MRYILSGGVLANGLHYKIDVNAMSCRLSKDGCETSDRETFSSLIMELNRMGITWGVPPGAFRLRMTTKVYGFVLQTIRLKTVYV